ncbi:MAG: putative phosphoesterase [Actinomycetia bacterium]|nr:putative phosphoesterase [Actinomycetes bacterium]
MNPREALSRIAELLMRGGAPVYRSQAFHRAAKAIEHMPEAELRRLADGGRLRDIPGVGEKTAIVIEEALAGETPEYLQKLLEHAGTPDSAEGAALRAQLRGDLHVHSDWSDGGDTILDMATKARDVGHQYMALTDHSPRLKIAHGLTPERLREQLDVVADVNRELAPFRLLSGIEVDILEDGSLDQEDELLAEIDVVVASVHSKLRMNERDMTARMVKAMSNPHADILGHCTGRLVTGRGRPPSTFDTTAVFETCRDNDKAVEINCRPERLDPPREMLQQVVGLGIKVAISTDAHATEQLEWQLFGTERAAECGVEAASVVNAWPVDDLVAWCNSH